MITAAETSTSMGAGSMLAIVVIAIILIIACGGRRR